LDIISATTVQCVL